MQYDAMFDSQNGKCAICDKPPQAHKKLGVDHDHKTGQVRGLLCSPCNRALGGFQDSLELLRKVVDYIEYFQRLANEKSVS